MNQIRDLLMGFLLALAFGLWFGHPENWTWAASGGPYVVNSISFLADLRPWSIILLLALAIALFMTRLKF